MRPYYAVLLLVQGDWKGIAFDISQTPCSDLKDWILTYYQGRQSGLKSGSPNEVSREGFKVRLWGKDYRWCFEARQKNNQCHGTGGLASLAPLSITHTVKWILFLIYSTIWMYILRLSTIRIGKLNRVNSTSYSSRSWSLKLKKVDSTHFSFIKVDKSTTCSKIIKRRLTLVHYIEILHRM